jgi:hypothetical protein
MWSNYLPCECEALNSNPSPTKRKRKKGRVLLYHTLNNVCSSSIQQMSSESYPMLGGVPETKQLNISVL